MKKNLAIAMLVLVFLGACKQSAKQESTEIPRPDTVESVADEITTSTSTNKDGKKLELVFNNTKGTVTLSFDDETIELISQKPASGIWYKNNRYELRGKGNDIVLRKDENIVFEHQDDIVNLEVKNTKGDVLNMTFNNTEGTVKAYLNGGDQLDLVQEKAASGVWYKNDQYELRGKGDNYDLLKDGKTVFTNWSE
ncbi:MliC family protein [Mariniflexile ostreae]|uniref:MliC family protein n=1 Tax=Mariniflexile ostreae TaxID=1520892 RepID=A0ABV5FES6_9FLAO